MIIASDIHLKDDSAETVFTQVLPGLHDAALASGDKDVALLGDIYHLRYRVDIWLQNALRDELRRWYEDGISVQIIPGNHDQINVEGRNALEALGDLRGVEVHTEPVANGDGLWIPYRKRDSDVRAVLGTKHLVGRALNISGVRVAFMHHGLVGALMNDAFPSAEGLNSSEFSGFDIVFCGHFHKRQQLGNVVYVGSPYETKADEAGQPKGYVTWDSENWSYVDTDWGKKYHSVFLDAGSELDLSQYGPNDEVRVRTGSGVDPEKVGRMLAEANIGSHSVTPEVEELETRLDMPANAGLRSVAQAYAQLDSVPSHLNGDRLMAVFAEITS